MNYIAKALSSSILYRLSCTQANVILESRRQYNFNRVHTVFHDRHTAKHPLRFHDDKWVRRRGGGWDEHLTKENETFISKLANLPNQANSPLKNPPWALGEYKDESIRTGVIALKIGSHPLWTKEGNKVNCTLLQVLDNHVIDYLPPTDVKIPVWTTNRNLNLIDSTKTGVCVVGALSCDPRSFTRAYNNLFTKAGCLPKRKLSRFFITPNAAIQPGTPLYASHFRVGDYVDVQAKTIDYGFHGCMKRYGFKGQNKSHGVKKSHRRRGSVGCGRKRRRIIAGTKMPGFMGNKPRFLRGLKIWRIDNKNNVIYVQGPCIPGPMHAFVRIHDSTIGSKKCLITKDSHPPFPTYFPGSDEVRKDNEFAEELHKFGDASITY